MEAVADRSAFVHLHLCDLRTLPKWLSSCCSNQFLPPHLRLLYMPSPFPLHQYSLLHSPFVPHAGQGGTAFTPHLLLVAALHFLLLCHFQLKLLASSVFQSSLPLLMPKGQCWRPEIALCFSFPAPKGRQNTRSGCSESSQEFCSCCPSYTQCRGIGGSWAANIFEMSINSRLQRVTVCLYLNGVLTGRL